jgi:hypothetical protein
MAARPIEPVHRMSKILSQPSSNRLRSVAGFELPGIEFPVMVAHWVALPVGQVHDAIDHDEGTLDCGSGIVPLRRADLHKNGLNLRLVDHMYSPEYRSLKSLLKCLPWTIGEPPGSVNVRQTASASSGDGTPRLRRSCFDSSSSFPFARIFVADAH